MFARRRGSATGLKAPQRDELLESGLRALPAERIVRAIAHAGQLWQNAKFAPRARVTQAIVQRTGYSQAMVHYALDRLFLPLDEAALRAAIVNELGSLEALDGFAPRAGRPDGFARGVGRVCIIASRTTVGVALLPAIYALCAKCDVLVKDREDHLIAEFFTTLCEQQPEFSAAVARPWSGAKQDCDVLRTADVLVAFGKRESLRILREATPPGTRFIGFGSRASAGYVARGALSSRQAAQDLARRAARDLILYESEGCLSLHLLFVESGGELCAEELCPLLARAIEDALADFGRARRSREVQARLNAYRQLSFFRAATGKGATYTDSAGTYCLTFDPPDDEPPAFLPCTIGVHAVANPGEALRYLRRHAIPLEGFALSESRPDLLNMAIDAGANRVTSFGKLQRPPASGDHGGRPRIAEFVRWIDKEL